jgi:hypothetical protein
MHDTVDHSEHRDRGLILKAIGALMLLGGIAVAFVGPVEMYCFYLFSEGGRFHYEGFGVGAFMFANIASQIMGYYLIAVTGISLGYGHLTGRRWARALVLTLLWFWVLAGFPLMIVAYLMFIQAKDPTLGTLLASLPVALIVYPVAPVALIRFYQGKNVQATFERTDPTPSWLDSIPLAVRVLCALLCLYVLALHVMILLHGLFPLFGTLLSNLPGIVALDVVILVLVGLIWGLARMKVWSWWGTLITFGGLTVSSLVTLPRYTFGDILLLLSFPPLETAAFQNVPFQSHHITAMAGVPLLVTVALVVFVKRHFRSRSATGHSASQPTGE